MKRGLLLLLLLSAGLRAACDLDAAFGSGGYKTYSAPAGGAALGRDLVALGNGEVLVVGAGVNLAGDRDAVYWRLFGSGGVIDAQTFSGMGGGSGVDEEFYAAAVAPDGGSVVLAGYAMDAGGNTKLALLRRDLPGLALYPGFGSGGCVTATAASPARGVAIDASGRIYTVDDGGLKRWTSVGALDTSWGSGGNFVFDAAGTAYDLRMDSQGRLVLAGANSTGLAVWRVLPSGGLDPAFGSGGRVQRSFGGAFDSAGFESLVLDATDGVLALGGDLNALSLRSQWLAWSLSSSGVPDPSFGSSGLAQGVTVSSLTGTQMAEGALGSGSGWMLLGRHPGASYEQPSMWALKADGSLDGSFGTGGQSLSSTAPGTMRRARMQGAYAYATGGLGSNMVVWRLSPCSLGGQVPTPTPAPALTALAGVPAGKAIAYPNPAKGKVFIAVQPPDNGLHVAIFDEAGRQLTEANRDYNAVPGVWEIDVRSYAPGVYYYVFRGGSTNPPPGKFAVLP